MPCLMRDSPPGDARSRHGHLGLQKRDSQARHLLTWISIRAKKTGPEVARAPRRAAIPPQAARGDLGSRGRGAHAACWPQPRAVAPRAAHHGPLPALPRLAAKVIAASATRGAAPPPDLRTRQITFFCAASCATLPLELVGAARRTARGRVNAAQCYAAAGRALRPCSVRAAARAVRALGAETRACACELPVGPPSVCRGPPRRTRGRRFALARMFCCAGAFCASALFCGRSRAQLPR